MSSPPQYAQCVASYLYESPVDQLIQQLKFAHQLTLAHWASQRLAHLAAPLGADLIIPMPLHPTRLKERGFNQAAQIAGLIGKALDIPVDRDSLIRTRHSPPQSTLSRDERQRSPQHAFACQTDLRGKSILLIDDVLTTGSSANECSRVLRLHGARNVNVGVVARTAMH